MIGLDTNVLVRLMVADEPHQSARVARFLAERCTPEQPGYVSAIVLCELVWVLGRVYKYQRAAVVAALDALLRNPALIVEGAADAAAALMAFRSGSADFADCLMGLRNAKAGCKTTVTLDRAAARLPQFTHL